MNTRTRTFHNPTSGATWSTFTEGNSVTVTSGKPGKEKSAVKPQTDALAARRFLDKEEGSRLRKGFRLTEPRALPGEPVMLRFLDRGYTGAMSLAFHQDKILTNQYVEDRDALWLIDHKGEGGPISTLAEGRLVWKILAIPALEMFLLSADHQVLSWNSHTHQFAALTQPNARPVSVLDCAGTTAVWFEDPELVVRNLQTGTDLLRRRLEPHLYSGHTLQLAAALSPDGSLVAYSAEPGIIIICDVSTGQDRQVLGGDFAMIGELAFTRDAHLIAKEEYGGWSLFAFDIATGMPRSGWPDFGNLGNGSFALDPTERRLALSVRDKVRIYDLTGFELLQEFTVDQCAKRSVLAWSPDGMLAVRTDLGVVGLYAT